MIRLWLSMLVLILYANALYALDWEEAGIPSGGRVIVAGEPGGGWVSCVLAFPAGVADAADSPATAHLAARLFLEAGGEGESLSQALSERGWQSRLEMSEDAAMILLSGPAEDLPTLMNPIEQAIMGRAGFSEADLVEARRMLEADHRRWAANSEAMLRSRLSERLYGDHPYAAGLGHRWDATPSAEEIRSFLESRYGPAGMLMVLAGDLKGPATLEAWLPMLEGLTGPPVPEQDWPKPRYGSGRIEGETSRRGLLLMQIPGLPVGDPRAAQLALASGVIQLLCEADLRDAGLARSVSSWYRFVTVGPAFLEITLRGLDAEKAGRAEVVLERVLERIRQGEFSEFMVISAKDRLFQRLEIHSSLGELPSMGVVELVAWTAETARQALLMRGERASFEARLTSGNIGSISAFASDWLLPERAVIGLSLP